MSHRDKDGDFICALCERGTVLLYGDAVLCKLHGLVLPTASCRRFRYDPTKRTIKPLPSIPRIIPPPDDL